MQTDCEPIITKNIQANIFGPFIVCEACNLVTNSFKSFLHCQDSESIPKWRRSFQHFPTQRLAIKLSIHH